MKKTFIDLVVCTHPKDSRKFLFRAPTYEVKEGDKVKVETKKGIQDAIVVATYSVFDKPDDEIYNFIVKAMGSTMPPNRVVERLVVKKIDWSDYEEENEEERGEEDV